MSINVRFFASLKERIGSAALEIDAQGITTARDVWTSASGQEADEEMLVAINKEYAALDRTVTDGDEVAFFPPVTGG
jgi:molybdopterin synthase sulfur carrier subunit